MNPQALEMLERVLEVLEMHIETVPDNGRREFVALAALRRDLIERIAEMPEGAWDDRPDWKAEESNNCPPDCGFKGTKHIHTWRCR